MHLRLKLVALIILGSLITLFSCSDKTEDSNGSASSDDKEYLQEQIVLDSITSVALSKEAKKVTEDWMMYIALNSEIDRFKTYTVSDLINNAGTINTVVDSLARTIPKGFETKAIKARIITLKTHSELLKDNSARIEPKASEIEELSAKLKLDFNNLNIQLNEVFIMDNNTEVSN